MQAWVPGCHTHTPACTHSHTLTKVCDNFSSFSIWTSHSHCLQLTFSIHIMLLSLIHGWWMCLQPVSLAKISKYTYKYFQISIAFAQKYNKLHSYHSEEVEYHNCYITLMIFSTKGYNFQVKSHCHERWHNCLKQQKKGKSIFMKLNMYFLKQLHFWRRH